jgi:hypothetical protein
MPLGTGADGVGHRCDIGGGHAVVVPCLEVTARRPDGGVPLVEEVLGEVGVFFTRDRPAAVAGLGLIEGGAVAGYAGLSRGWSGRGGGRGR